MFKKPFFSSQFVVEFVSIFLTGFNPQKNINTLDSELRQILSTKKDALK
jgi:hypothetical protein